MEHEARHVKPTGFQAEKLDIRPCAKARSTDANSSA